MRHIMGNTDRQLGMGAAITRRDFLNGVAVGVGGAIISGGVSGDLDALLAQGSAPYPPALTGLRGSHQGSFEVLHALRDAAFWTKAGPPQDTREEYDLVVVGAGISGLAAAHYFKKARPDARILILDNHDDFGGHAKRNEFSHEGRTYIGYGGTQSIDSPAPYSKVSKDLHHRARHRGRPLLDGARLRALQVTRPWSVDVLQQGGVRRRPPRRRGRA